MGFNSSTVGNSFWDTETSGKSSSMGGTGKNTAEMKNHRTFTDVSWSAGLSSAWDFETNPYDDAANNNYWDMDYSTTINNGYPYLSWQNGGDVSLPVGLSLFSACFMEDGVLLEWITESEVNNLGYILERKTADTDWIQIASFQTHDELKGQGNTSARTEYEFVDTDALPGETYLYRISDVDTEGTITVDDIITITIDDLPEKTALKPAYPNPFNPDTKIQYTLAEDMLVSLKVVDMMGRTVRTIIHNVSKPAGSYSVHWHGNDMNSKPAASGVYFLVMKAGETMKTQKVMLMR